MMPDARGDGDAHSDRLTETAYRLDFVPTLRLMNDKSRCKRRAPFRKME
jgi:hypothetical protein